MITVFYEQEGKMITGYPVYITEFTFQIITDGVSRTFDISLLPKDYNK